MVCAMKNGAGKGLIIMMILAKGVGGSSWRPFYR